jgi:hypothetical protein
MEAGKVNITGPISVAVDAMLKGYDPFEDENDDDCHGLYERPDTL